MASCGNVVETRYTTYALYLVIKGMKEIIPKVTALLLRSAGLHYHTNNRASGLDAPKGFYIRVGVYAGKPCIRVRPVNQNPHDLINLIGGNGFAAELRPDYLKSYCLEPILIFGMTD